MRCSDFRDQLTRSAGERAAAQVEREAASHLASCPACARYAQRLGEARTILSRQAEVMPTPFFVRRVVARLPSPSQVLGWAAVRALPAAIAIALAIGAFGLLQTPSTENPLLVDDTSSEALLTYAALPNDGGSLAPSTSDAAAPLPAASAPPTARAVERPVPR